jgi:hypothetical protein
VIPPNEQGANRGEALIPLFGACGRIGSWGSLLKDYYQENHEAYHDQTFDIDPASFLTPLVRSLTPGSGILDVGCVSTRSM